MKLLTFTAVMFCLVSAFAGDKEKEIIGKWIDGETGEASEYKTNGQIEQTLSNGEIMRGRYSFTDQDHILIELKSDLIPVAPVITPIAIDGDEMQIIGSDGKKVKKLKREKP